MADFVTPVDDAFDASSGIGAPQHTSTPLPKRRAVPSLTIPVPDTNHHVPTLSSLHPMSSPSYLHPTRISSPNSFFPSYSAMYYSPSFGPGTCTASSYPLLPSPSFLPPSPSYLSWSTAPGVHKHREKCDQDQETQICQSCSCCQTV